VKRFLRRLVTWPIRVYQRWISPYTPAMCRFRPTCSQYAVEAVEHHGVFKGGLYATWRLLRCHPFTAGGWDPVPGTPEREYRDRCCAKSEEHSEN
jgi:uncharacterized protein